MLDIIEVLSSRDASGHIEEPVGWEDYLASRDDQVAELDEAIVELTQVLASLSAVDGAVVLTRRFEILGFGAEITGELTDVYEVVRSRDAEARETTLETAAGMGTAPFGLSAVSTRSRSAGNCCVAGWWSSIYQAT